MKALLLYHLALLSLLIIAVSSLRRRNDDRTPRLVTLPPAPNNGNDATNVTVLPRIIGHHDGYLVNVSLSAIFSIQRSDTNTLQAVSQQSRLHSCQVAMNGGPFQTNGDAVGGVIVNGHVVQDDFQETNVGFGITSSQKWILGGIYNVTEAKELQVEHYVTGFDWLVYQGSVIVPRQDGDRNLRFKRQRAPRTAIGVDKHGRLLLLVVDGCEACLRHQGLTLQQLARLFQSHGVHHAINLDGGGSTTLVRNDVLVNIPTCHDIPWKCERPVATIVCLQDGNRDEEMDSGEEEASYEDEEDEEGEEEEEEEAQ